MHLMENLHGDHSQRVVVSTARMDWEASPSPSVWRKRLERIGPAESGRVTSVVRYDPGASFPAHDHPQGEEILVLEGVFSDERGDFPSGSYMLNPEGFRHAPRSGPGCLLFVKLCQYGGAERETVLVETTSATWLEDSAVGVRRLPLYESSANAESVALLRMGPGAALGRRWYEVGAELFVVGGFLVDEHGIHPKGTWIRMPRRSAHTPRTDTGCTVYLKTGGFPR